MHSSGSNVSRLVLEIEVEKLFGLGLDNIVEIHQDSYICRQCDTNLLRVSELEHQLRQLKSELHSSIKAFHPKPSSASTEAGVKRKASSDATATASKRQAPVYLLDLATPPSICIAEHPHSQVAGTESAATSSQVLSTQQPKSPPITKSIICMHGWNVDGMSHA